MIITPGTGSLGIGSPDPVLVVVAAPQKFCRVRRRVRLALVVPHLVRRGLGAVASTGPP